MYLRDENGRTLNQAAIASGSKKSQNDSVLFGMLTPDNEIVELDPDANQYPLMTSATHEISDQSTIVYALISKNPSLLA